MNRKNSGISRSRQLFIQKLVGIGVLIICVGIILTALSGTTTADRDATPALLLAPLGLFLLFTRKVYLIF